MNKYMPYVGTGLFFMANAINAIKKPFMVFFYDQMPLLERCI